MKRIATQLRGPGRWLGLMVFTIALGAGCPGTEPVDAGNEPDPVAEPEPTPEEDAGTPEEDAGTPEEDAGTPEEDAGTPEEDAGTPEEDAGTPEDGGVNPPTDGGGPPPADGGPPPPVDGGGPPPADGGPPPPVDGGGPPPADGGPPPPVDGGGPPPVDGGGPPPPDAGPPPVDAGPPPVDAGPPPVDAGPPPVDGGPAGNAPVLAESHAVLAGDTLIVNTTGTDVDGDVTGFVVTARDTIGGDVFVDVADLFNPGFVEFTGADFNGVFAFDVTGLDVAELDVAITDATGLTSNVVLTTVDEPRGPGATCIADTFALNLPGCDAGSTCENIAGYTGTCEAAVGVAPVLTSAVFVEAVTDDAECIADDPAFPLALRYRLGGTSDAAIIGSTFVSEPLTGPDPLLFNITGTVGPGAFTVVALICGNSPAQFDEIVATVGVQDDVARVSNTIDITFPDLAPNPPPEWTCPANFYNAGDGCDCGCGAVDLDCADATAASCAFCGGDGSCGDGTACPANIDPDNNAICGVSNIPPEWTCNPAFYEAADGCDCGCGVVDPDCADATVASCAFCDDPGSCSEGEVGCPGLVDPVDNGICTP